MSVGLKSVCSSLVQQTALYENVVAAYVVPHLKMCAIAFGTKFSGQSMCTAALFLGHRTCALYCRMGDMWRSRFLSFNREMCDTLLTCNWESTRSFEQACCKLAHTDWYVEQIVRILMLTLVFVLNHMSVSNNISAMYVQFVKWLCRRPLLFYYEFSSLFRPLWCVNLYWGIYRLNN